MIFGHFFIFQAFSFRLVAEKTSSQEGNDAARLAFKALVTESVTSEVQQLITYHSKHVEQSDTSGLSEDGTELPEDRTGLSENRTGKLTLLTSFFKADHGHWAELAGALYVNLHNPFFDEVHVLMQSPGGSECEEIQDTMSSALNGVKLSEDAQRRLICVPVLVQPTYGGFFEYANSKLAGKIVVLANTDVAFDGTLGLIDSVSFDSGKLGYVLSVQPPPYGGEYSQMFGTECASEPRCTIGEFDGWRYGGDSWDAYVFHSPLRGMQSQYLDHFMNTPGGENRAAYQIEKAAGVSLSNPCDHIHAFHWHCSGGKMHAMEGRVDGDVGENGVRAILPCWDCPGMRFPEGKAPLKELCAHGSRQALANTPLHISVRNRECTFACLSSSNATPTKLCQSSGDVDCIISDCGKAPHQYY